MSLLDMVGFGLLGKEKEPEEERPRLHCDYTECGMLFQGSVAYYDKVHGEIYDSSMCGIRANSIRAIALNQQAPKEIKPITMKRAIELYQQGKLRQSKDQVQRPSVSGSMSGMTVLVDKGYRESRGKKR